MSEVSIITASYNYENYIKEAIESVINQNFQDWEMIIVDDGSKDNSVAVIKEYCEKDSRIKLFQHENNENKGLAETIKLGISKANSKWIAFLESDDTITENYLSEKFKIIEKYNNVNFIFNDVCLFGEDVFNSEMNSYLKNQKKRLSKYIFPTSLLPLFKKHSSNIIPTFSCVMMKKDLIINLDFNSPIKPALDLYLWNQIVSDCVFYYIDSKLTNWRIHNDSYMCSFNTNYRNKYLFDCKRNEFLYKNSLLRFALISLNYVIKRILKYVKGA